MLSSILSLSLSLSLFSLGKKRTFLALASITLRATETDPKLLSRKAFFVLAKDQLTCLSRVRTQQESATIPRFLSFRRRSLVWPDCLALRLIEGQAFLQDCKGREDKLLGCDFAVSETEGVGWAKLGMLFQVDGS